LNRVSLTDLSYLCRGIPVYVFEIRHLDSKTVAQYEKTSAAAISRAPTDGTTPPKLLRLFALYENLTRFVHPLGTELTDREHPNTPITMSTNIVDVSGVSLRMFWNLKGHMQAASHLATAHYPETLDRIFVSGRLMTVCMRQAQSFHFANGTAFRTRSSARPSSSPPSGLGSSAGSTRSPSPRSSSCLRTR
jgi:hypothetical protein